MNKIPDSYVGREQAFVKHSILKLYLKRLFMIIGREKAPIINYVDCFAGPWQDGNEQFADTSIGVSLAEINSCREGLLRNFNVDVKFRALYIEKNPGAFKKLKTFLDNKPYSDIETHCLQGDYTSLTQQIIQWCGNHFTFFFVDPTGWKRVVGAATMRSLLRLPKSEFLINLMYDFLNRAASITTHASDMVELFGEVPAVENASPDNRRSTLLQLYRKNMKLVYGGRTGFVPVEKPGKDRVHYYLIYLTRNDVGLNTFKEEAEKLAGIQENTQQKVKMRHRDEKSGVADMFASDLDITHRRAITATRTDNAKMYLLGKLSTLPTKIDYKLWADFLEESDFYPSELQTAMKELVREGKVKNLNNDVTRRKTKIIRPDYIDKCESWYVT